MASSINASTSGVGGIITTADASGRLDLQTADVTRAYVSDSGLTVSRVNSASEGGQLDLCRSSDNASSWAVDVYGSTSTPSLRFVDNIASATRAEIDGSGNFKFNSGYGSAATAYGCRAWVNFNGKGTVAIRASANVSSITDNGTGTYTVNFTNSMPDANYSAIGNARFEVTGGGADYGAFACCFNLATGSVGIITADNISPNTAEDEGLISVSVFR